VCVWGGRGGHGEYENYLKMLVEKNYEQDWFRKI